jgi:hypothetical protein
MSGLHHCDEGQQQHRRHPNPENSSVENRQTEVVAIIRLPAEKPSCPPHEVRNEGDENQCQEYIEYDLRDAS